VEEEGKILVLGPQQKTTLTKYEQLFDGIIGYNDVKRLFNLSFSSEKPVHILLVGPPASAKTFFMF
jgi:Holliday junction DNA helicase RuvB